MPESQRKSSQTHYKGQEGWNDLGEMSSAASSRKGTPITSSTSSSTQAVGTNKAALASKDDSSENDYVLVQSEDVTKDQVMQEMTRLFETGSKLPERELNHYKQRLLGLLPDLNDHYPIMLDSVVKALKSTEGQVEAKQQLVEYSLTNNETSKWILPLRRLVESAAVET